MRSDWAEGLRKLLNKDEKESVQSSTAFVQEVKDKIQVIKSKPQRLLDSYLEQDIERETYLGKKLELISEKKTLEEQTAKLEQNHIGWVEPMRNWIERAENLEKIAQDSNLLNKKVAAKEIFGSNLLLQNKLVCASAPKIQDFAWGNQWDALWSLGHNSG